MELPGAPKNKRKKSSSKKFLMFQENGTFWNIKKFLIFSQKKAFLILRKTEPELCYISVSNFSSSKKFLIFWEMELSGPKKLN